MKGEHFVPDEQAMRALGAELVQRLKTGDCVLLQGELGAGKTTFVRGALRSLGFESEVRSPTFNLLQDYATDPPVLHADLYRVESAAGLGLEEYLNTHLCFIEWPDRLRGLLREESCWRVRIEFEGEGRRVWIVAPSMKR